MVRLHRREILPENQIVATYAVKECFYTLQGEGAQTGRAAVFLRFAGCNLWSGVDRDRASAVCKFCDTDFVGVDGPGGGKFDTPEKLAAQALSKWKPDGGRKLIVCTGGEPLLQLDAPLIASLHAAGFEIAIETNGTINAPDSVDWICVSPKSTAALAQRTGDELKLVYPQSDAAPEAFAGLKFRNFFLQPMDGPDLARNTKLVSDYCLKHPQWRVSLQTHKLLGIP